MLASSPRLRLLAAAVLTLALGGCATNPADAGADSGAGASSSSAEAPTAEAATSGPATPTAQASEAEFTASVPVTDVDGYEFTIDVSTDITSAEKDVSMEKPGLMSVRFGTEHDVTLINDTPGRIVEFKNVSGITSPYNQPTIAVFAGWEGTSAICQNSVGGQDTDPKCGTLLGFGRIDGPLSVDGSKTLTMFKGIKGGPTAGIAGLPEELEAQVLEEAAAPDFYHVMFSGAEMERFEFLCPTEDGPMGGMGYGVLYSTTGACEDFRLVEQPESLN